MLFDYHYGEGAYAETERAIQSCWAWRSSWWRRVRPEDAPGAPLAPQTEDQPGAYCGPYEAGGVWAVFDGSGAVRVNGTEILVDHPGAYELLKHEHHTRGTIEILPGAGVSCLATCFTPGLA